MKLLKFFIVFFLAFVLLYGCGLPKATLENAKSTEQGLKIAAEEIEKAKNDFEKEKKSESFAFFSPYAERENWDNYYKEATEEISHAKSIFEKNVKPILSENKKNDDVKLKKLLNQVQQSYKFAVKKTKFTQERKAELERYQKEAPSIVDNAEKSIKDIDEKVLFLSKFVDKAKSDYYDKEKDITSRFSPFTQNQTLAHEKIKIAQSELRNHSRGHFTDYAKLGDSCKQISEIENWVTSEDVKLRSKIGELYQSYSKILLDMKEKHEPWIQRVKYEWDEYSDWDTTSVTSDKKVFISDAEYKKWVNTLNSNPDGYRESSGYGYEVLIEDADIDSYYYHRYTIIKDGQKTDTDWIKVNEDTYEDNLNYLGMEILSKPFGAYEEDTITEATPPGMANVGDAKHGEWRQDSNGHSFWYYYGIYSFLNGNNHSVIYRDSYNNWNRNYRNEGAYYGRDRSGNQRFGTNGSLVRTSSRYQNTEFARRGGLKTAPSSIKSAGSSMRGGGPGGGGK